MASGGLVKDSESTEYNVNPLAYAKSIEAKAPCVVQIIRQCASLPVSLSYVSRERLSCRPAAKYLAACARRWLQS